MGYASTTTGAGWSFGRAVRNAARRYINHLERLNLVAERLRGVQIECSDALECIRRYDSPVTLFYCDPPYPPEARTETNVYLCDMTTEQHIALAEVLRSVQGLVALSGYDCELYRRLYEGWNVYRDRPRHSMVAGRKILRQEVLYTNYRIEDFAAPISLFGEDEVRDGTQDSSRRTVSV